MNRCTQTQHVDSYLGPDRLILCYFCILTFSPHTVVVVFGLIGFYLGCSNLAVIYSEHRTSLLYRRVVAGVIGFQMFQNEKQREGEHIMGGTTTKPNLITISAEKELHRH